MMTLQQRMQDAKHQLDIMKPCGGNNHLRDQLRTILSGFLDLSQQPEWLDQNEHRVCAALERVHAFLRNTVVAEAAQDLEEFAFGAAWNKLKELGRIAKDNFMQGYRRGRGIPEPAKTPEPKAKKPKAKPAPKDEPKAEPTAEPKAEPKKAPTKKRPKPAPAEPTAEPKKEPKAKPGLEKRKAARKARKSKKAPPAPAKDKAPPKAKTPAKGAKKKATKGKVKPGTVEPAPNAKNKVRVMGKDGKWIYYDKQEYAKMKKGKK